METKSCVVDNPQTPKRCITKLKAGFLETVAIICISRRKPYQCGLSIYVGTTVGNSTDAKSGGGRGSYWHDLSDVSDEKIQIFRTAKDGFDVRCEREMCWRPMVTTHWPRLLQHYGNQTEGRYNLTMYIVGNSIVGVRL